MPNGGTIDTSALKLTFQDEFNTFSASPDGSTGRWQSTYDWGNRTLGSNGEEQFYSDDSVGVNPFSIRNGVLDISAKPGGNPLNLPYTSGAITTESSFSQLYGYFEIRAELPAGQGLWPAFWLLPADHSWPPELDVFEVLGNSPTTLYFSTHSSVQATQGTTLKVADVSKAFHTYGVMWDPQEVHLYIDGVETAAMPTPADMHKPMYMLANLAVGGYWPGSPDGSTPFPANMLIDYVHAYAYPGTTGGTVTVTDPSANVGATNVAPVIATPTRLGTVAGTRRAIAGVTVSDNWPGGTFNVTVSDNTGRLATSTTAGVLESGRDTTSLTLSGGLAAVNAALATLTYQASTSDDEYLWISAVDPQGLKQSAGTLATATDEPIASAPAPISAVPVVTASASLTLSAGAPQRLTGISVAVSAPSGPISVIVSDSAGALSADATDGATISGQNSTALSLIGTPDAINASLETLIYQVGSTPGVDWLWVSANDASGAQGLTSSVITSQIPAAVAASTTGEGDEINALTVANVSQGLAALQTAGSLSGPATDLGLTATSATASRGFGGSNISLPTFAVGGSLSAPSSARIFSLLSDDPPPDPMLHSAADGCGAR